VFGKLVVGVGCVEWMLWRLYGFVGLAWVWRFDVQLLEECLSLRKVLERWME
jgi:hypothetical protein